MNVPLKSLVSVCMRERT